jgi:magnesium chelatase subunit I
VELPDFVVETIERIAFLARTDKRIDQRSGVSQRMPITVLENVISNAERRAIANAEGTVVPRITDIYAALPAITGKLELEYEGELAGAGKIARELIAAAAAETLDAWGGAAAESYLHDIVDYFDRGAVLQLGDTAAASAAVEGFGTVAGLIDAVRELGIGRHDSPGHVAAACELVLEALVARRRLTRTESGSYGRAAPRRPKPPPPFQGPVDI